MEPFTMRDASAKPGKFSKIELRDILVSVVVLSLAFMLMFRDANFITTFFEKTLGTFWYIGLFALMFTLVVLSFITHEMGHKFTAQRYGLWSEYRMFPMGLLIALVMGAVGFLFAAPGVVYINGYVDREQDGKISLAGPLVNIALSAIGLAGCLLFNGNAIIILFYLLFVLNSSLALFNLLPIGILDGAKIMRWDSGIWIMCIAIAGILFVSKYLGFLPAFYYTI